MANRPNIVIITTHDSGTHFGCYGVDTVHTEAIHALAADGVRLDNMYCTSPVCSPSRASLTTGRHPQSNGMFGLLHSPWDWRLNEGERHLASLLSEAGYESALFGFQHEHTDPAGLGFERVEASQPLPRADEVAQAFAGFAANRDDGRPSYAQIGFWETHRPWDRYGDGPDDSEGVWVPPYLEDNPAWLEDLAGLQGVIRVVDEAVAIISKALRDHDVEENTIVIFTTDHGIEFPRAKWFCYDPGIRVATIVRWPGGGLIGGRVCDQLLSNVDVLPTLFKLIGLEVPPNVEGMSFAACVRDESAPSPRDTVYGMFLGRDNRFLRTTEHKLIRNFGATRYPQPPVAAMGTKPGVNVVPVELYDLETDPNEFSNVADEPEYAQLRAELDEKLWDWLEELDDPILRGPTPTPAWERAMADYRSRRESQR